MKKKVAILLAAALVLGGLLAGCGKEAAKSVDVDTVASSLRDGLKFEDELKEIDASILGNFYPSVDGAKLNGFKLYKSSSGATAEEIAVFEGKDSAAAADLEKAVETRVEDLRAQFEDYIPAELKKIEDAVTETQGNLVVLVVSGDAASAQSILDDLF